MFDFNVRPLWKSGEILTKYEGLAFLGMDVDNVYFLSEYSLAPINLTLYSTTNLPITFEAKAISGSAEVHTYIYNSEESLNDELIINKIKGYKHLSKFSVDDKDKSSHYDTITAENSFRQNLYFEVKAKKDCLFFVHLYYNQENMKIPVSKQAQGKFKDGKFYGYIEMLPEYDEIVLNVDKMTPTSIFTVYAKTNILNSNNFKTMMVFSFPSENNYDVKGRTLSFNPTLSLRIKNIPKEFYEQGKKIITMIYIQSENYLSYNDKFNMIVYPNVDHYERITPVPNKYIYSSLTDKDVDETVFSFKQQNTNDNLLVIEVSACRGNFGYTLTRSTNQKPNYLEDSMQEKGKKVIVTHIDRNVEYLLSVYGLREDEMLFSDSEVIYEGIDFLLYYYTTTSQEYMHTYFNSKLNYDIKEPGHIILHLPNLETVNAKNGKNKLY